MNRYKKYGFSRVYSIDHLNQLPVDPRKSSMSFILNIMPSTVKFGHWVAIYMTKQNLEYYDPLAQEPSPAFLHQIKPILDKWNADNALQFKVNKIRFQRTNSNNCGYFSIKFLVDRYNKLPFKECTGYTKLVESIKGEREIKKFKKQFHLPDFKSI